MPWSPWRGQSPAECVGVAAGLTRAGHSQELFCAARKVSACGVCLGKVLSAPKGTPGVLQAQDGAGETPGLSGRALGSDWVGEGFSCSKPYLLP